MDTLAFAAARREIMDRSDDELTELVIEALDNYAQGRHDWFDDLVMAATVLFSEIFESETGRDPDPNDIAAYESAAVEALEKTTPPTDPPSDAQIERVTRWLTVFTVNNAMLGAFGTEGQVELQWVTMHDGAVRDIHVAADGQRRIAGAPFDIDGQPLHFPGEPVGPPHGWINCRCILMRVPEEEMTATITDPTTLALAAASAPPQEEVVEVEEIDDDVPGWDEGEIETEMFWHGVIAPTGVTSGDSRRFAVDALRTRDLPVPLRWQKIDMPGHDGSVVVANITRVWEDGGLIKAEGRFAVNAEADEVIALIADEMLRGVSVDLDDATVELQNEDGSQFDLDNPSQERPVETIVEGRVASAALVSIPAFQEAFVALGPWGDDDTLVAAGCAPCAAREIDGYYQSWSEFAVSEGAWDGAASRFTDEEWFRSTLVHRNGDSTLKADNALPILEPNGDVSRAGVHEAAARIDQVEAPPEALARARKGLIAAYAKIDEEPPESLVAAAFPPVEVTEASPERAARLDADIEAFAPGTKDGPGWVTNPKETQRLRTYWTKGKGAAKIRWGAPGDFNRCRKQLAKYVPNPHFLAGTCSNLHKVALGVWPGQESGKHAVQGAIVAAAFTVADIAPTHVPPADWFVDPALAGPTPVTVTQDGRIFGHLAAFGVCHSGLGLSVGQGEACTTAPRSPSGYAYFRTGALVTDGGEVAVGHISIGTGHAKGSLSAMPAAAHYDNTGSVAADVAAGEDEYGIWIAGSVRPGTDIVALRSATLSGDWRTIGARQAYELVGALAVNVPGFPIPRLAISAGGGRPASLVAAGIVAPATVEEIEVGEVTVDSRAVAREIFAEMRQITARAKTRQELVATTRAMRVARIRERCANL